MPFVLFVLLHVPFPSGTQFTFHRGCQLGALASGCAHGGSLAATGAGHFLSWQSVGELSVAGMKIGSLCAGGYALAFLM